MNGQATLIRVTSQHIADGITRDCERCPVALAVKDALGDLFTPGTFVDAYTIAIMVLFPGEIWEATTPDEAAAFIENFDGMADRSSLGPFEFTATWWVTKREREDRPW